MKYWMKDKNISLTKQTARSYTNNPFLSLSIAVSHDFCLTNIYNFLTYPSKFISNKKITLGFLHSWN